MFKVEMKKYFLSALLVACTSNAYAQQVTVVERAPTTSSASSLNLNIPSAPQNFQQDRVRAGDFECSSAIGSSTNVEFGVVGILNQDDPYYSTYTGGVDYTQAPTRFASNGMTRDVGVYARIVVPIGAPKERPNCNLLYKLELEKKRLEVMRLQAEIEQLRNLQFEE